MPELEQALAALGRELDFPPEPDLVPGVRERLERRRWRRPVVFAVALLVVAFGIAMAVPQARSAILRFFHIGAVTVERVETLPAVQQRPLTAGLGPALSRRAAEAEAKLAVPFPRLGGPYYARSGLIATILRAHGKPVLLAELQGDQVGVMKKVVTPQTRIEFVHLGEFGLWLEGGRHALYWQFGRIEPRAAGSVLLWLLNGTTYRLEGDLAKGQMIELAHQITH